MSTRDESETLRRRALAFLDTAEYLLKKEVYDLACFNAEQAGQLYCKAALIEAQGEYPRTHSIIELLALLSEASGSENGGIRQPRREALRLLETAYITSRYFSLKFPREDAESLISTVKEVFRIVDQIKETQRKS